MRLQESSFFITSVSVLLTGLVVAGCTAKAPRSTTQVELQNTTTSEQAAQTTDTPTQASTSTTTSTVLGKNTMKQLSDFEPIVGTEVTMTTNKGVVVFTLFREGAPITTLNFLTLVKAGFYDSILFHRVIPDFMAQFGDPLTLDAAQRAAWGTGGAGYTIPDEFSAELRHDSEGIVSMANSGPNSSSSQVFITYGPTPHLDGKHTVFGKVTSGMEVLRALTNGDQIVSVTFK